MGGVGLVVSAAEALLHGHRTRSLSPRELALARRYFSSTELELACVHEGSVLFARGLRIAFVVGRIVKTWGPPSPALLMHELVHVRQFRRWGWAYVAKALAAQAGQGYSYVGRNPLTLNAEQEAARLEDIARADMGMGRRYVCDRRVA